jgi:hypothetical protein
MGGLLSIQQDGSVWHYDPDEQILVPVEDETWIRAATIAGAEKFPELKTLVATGAKCTVCEGAGWIAGVRCGTCLGSGML